MLTNLKPYERTKVLKLATQLVERARKNYRDYDEARAAWYRSSDTRGYRFPECIHGVSLITDYDPMCGPCEDGYSYFDYTQQARDALFRARQAYDESMRRWNIVFDIMGMGYDKPQPLADWATSAMELENIR